MRQHSASRPDGAPTTSSEDPADAGPGSGSRPGARAEVVEPQPLPWRTTRVVLWGIGLWVLALAVTLAVPALHTGDRSWWPWSCVAGIVLGLLGYSYVRRGRGNASDA